MVAVMPELAGVAPLNLSEAGSWLCGRHSDLAALVDRINAMRGGEPNMPQVRACVTDYDMAVRMNLPPQSAMRHMMPTEVHRLRLLATLAPKSAFFDDHLQFCVRDLEGLGPDSRELVTDWMRCIRIGLFG